MEEKNSKPLVTVIVVTYNSARFILETLESIKAQSYENIELIISDDCSKDNTVELCQDWISRNIARFSNVKLVTTPQNTGTAGNANRALAVTTGEWVKFIAGDDLFCSDAIDKYMYFVTNNDIKVCFAEAIHFTGELSEKKFEYSDIAIERVAFGKKVTALDQYNILKKQFIGLGSTFFAKTLVLSEVGGFDERFPLMDDHPLFIRIAKAGYRFYILPQRVLYKRNHSESVSHQIEEDAIITKNIVRCIKDYKYQYKYENLNRWWRFCLRYSMYLNNLIIDMGNSRKGKKCMLVYGISLLSDPFLWYSRYLNLKDKILKRLKL